MESQLLFAGSQRFGFVYMVDLQNKEVSNPEPWTPNSHQINLNPYQKTYMNPEQKFERYPHPLRLVRHLSYAKGNSRHI